MQDHIARKIKRALHSNAKRPLFAIDLLRECRDEVLGEVGQDAPTKKRPSQIPLNEVISLLEEYVETPDQFDTEDLQDIFSRGNDCLERDCTPLIAATSLICQDIPTESRMSNISDRTDGVWTKHTSDTAEYEQFENARETLGNLRKHLAILLEDGMASTDPLQRSNFRSEIVDLLNSATELAKYVQISPVEQSRCQEFIKHLIQLLDEVDCNTSTPVKQRKISSPDSHQAIAKTPATTFSSPAASCLSSQGYDAGLIEQPNGRFQRIVVPSKSPVNVTQRGAWSIEETFYLGVAVHRQNGWRSPDVDWEEVQNYIERSTGVRLKFTRSQCAERMRLLAETGRDVNDFVLDEARKRLLKQGIDLESL